jgi:Cu/Ag efflux protein CusF
MKKALTIIVCLLFVFSIAGFCVAAEKAVGKKETAAPSAIEEKSVEKAPVKVKYVTGEVTAVDATAGTLTVKSKKKEVSLSTDNKTIIRMGKEKKTLADITSGEKVKVRYTEVDGKNMAKSIAIKPETTAAPEKTKKMHEKK